LIECERHRSERLELRDEEIEFEQRAHRPQAERRLCYQLKL
jgi:hypothetical protein